MPEYANSQEDRQNLSEHDKPVQKKTSSTSVEIIDNRPEAIAQRRILQMARNETGDTNTPNGPANNTGLPDNLKSGIEHLSGHSMDDVKVHYNSDKPAQLNAHAYAQGTDIHMAPGQEKHLPHEAWHVVQQKQGRVKPTMQLKAGVNVNDDTGLEKEADVMGAKALQTKADTNTRRLKNSSSTNVIRQNYSKGEVIQAQLKKEKFYFTKDKGDKIENYTYVSRLWHESLYDKVGTYYKIYGIYRYKGFVSKLVEAGLKLNQIYEMILKTSEKELTDIVNEVKGNYEDLTTVITKINKENKATLVALLKEGCDLANLKSLVESEMDAKTIKELVEAEPDKDKLKSLLDFTTAKSYPNLVSLISKVKEDGLLVELLKEEGDAVKLEKIIAKTKTNFSHLPQILKKNLDHELMIELLGVKSDAKKLQSIVENANAGFKKLPKLIKDVPKDKTLINLLKEQPDAEKLEIILSKTTKGFVMLARIMKDVKDLDTLIKLLAQRSNAIDLEPIVKKAKKGYNDLVGLIPEINDDDTLIKLLGKRSDASKLQAIIKKTKKGTYASLETILHDISNDTTVNKLLATRPDATKLEPIVKKATGGYNALTGLIPEINDDKILIKLLGQRSDVTKLQAIIKKTKEGTYASLETILRDISNDTTVIELLAERSDATKLEPIVKKAKKGYKDLAGLIPEINDDETLIKLLGQRPDATALKAIIEKTKKETYPSLETILRDIPNNSTVIKLLTSLNEADKLKKVVDKTTSNYEDLELLLKKIESITLAKLLEKEPDAQKLKNDLEAIKVPLESDGLSEDKIWLMVENFANHGQLGPAEIKSSIEKLRGHLESHTASSTSADKKDLITKSQSEGTAVGKKVLTGPEISDHLEHTVDKRKSSTKDLQNLFPTGQDFSGMKENELWHHCALDPADVTPGYVVTTEKLKDINTHIVETTAQAKIRQKLALKKLVDMFGPAAQRMFFENQGQKPRAADEPNVEDGRLSNAHTVDRHVINNTGKIQNDFDLAYRITQNNPRCPGKAGAFNNMSDGKADLQRALDHIYSNNKWGQWRKKILESGDIQEDLPCGSSSTHVFSGSSVTPEELPRYIHKDGEGIKPMHPGDNWTTNMRGLTGTTKTMIPPNQATIVAVAPTSVTEPSTGEFRFKPSSSPTEKTIGPASSTSLTSAVPVSGVGIRLKRASSAKGGFGFHSAWPY